MSRSTEERSPSARSPLASRRTGKYSCSISSGPGGIVGSEAGPCRIVGRSICAGRQPTIIDHSDDALHRGRDVDVPLGFHRPERQIDRARPGSQGSSEARSRRWPPRRPAVPCGSPRLPILSLGSSAGSGSGAAFSAHGGAASDSRRFPLKHAVDHPSRRGHPPSTPLNPVTFKPRKSPLPCW